MSVLLQVTVENITSRKDKTIKIVLGTQEITPENAGKLFELLNQLAFILISPKGINQEQIDAVEAVDVDLGGKTQSQRIRGVLYKLFEQDAEGYSNFDNYYKAKTEKYIEHLKAKIK